MFNINIEDQEKLSNQIRIHFNLTEDSSKIFTLLMKNRQIKQKDLLTLLNTHYNDKDWDYPHLKKPLEILKKYNLIDVDIENQYDIIGLEEIIDKVQENIENNLNFIESNKSDIIAEWESNFDNKKTNFIKKFGDIQSIYRDFKHLLPNEKVLLIGSKEAIDFFKKKIFSDYDLKHTRIIEQKNMNITIILGKNNKTGQEYSYIIFNQNIFEIDSECGIRIDNPDFYRFLSENHNNIKLITDKENK